MAILFIEDAPEIEALGDGFLVTADSGGERVQLLIPARALGIFQSRAKKALDAEFARRLENPNVIAFSKRKVVQ